MQENLNIEGIGNLPTPDKIISYMNEFVKIMSPHYNNQIRMEEMAFNNVDYRMRLKEGLLVENLESKYEFMEKWFQMVLERVLREFTEERYEVMISVKEPFMLSDDSEKRILQNIAKNIVLDSKHSAVYGQIFQDMLFGQCAAFVDITQGGAVKIHRISLGDAFFDCMSKDPEKAEGDWCGMTRYVRRKKFDNTIDKYIDFYWRGDNGKIYFSTLSCSDNQLVVLKNGSTVGQYPGTELPIVLFGFVDTRTINSNVLKSSKPAHMRGNGHVYNYVSSPLRRFFDMQRVLNIANETLLTQLLRATGNLVVLENADQSQVDLLAKQASLGFGFVALKAMPNDAIMPDHNTPQFQSQIKENPQLMIHQIPGFTVTPEITQVVENCRRVLLMAAGLTGSQVNGSAPNQSGVAIEQQIYQSTSGIRDTSRVMRRGLDQVAKIIFSAYVDLLSNLEMNFVYTNNLNEQKEISPEDLSLLLSKYDISFTAAPTTEMEKMKSRAVLKDFISAIPAAANYMGDIMAKTLPDNIQDIVVNRSRSAIDPRVIKLGDGEITTEEYYKSLEEGRQPSPDEKAGDAVIMDAKTRHMAARGKIENDRERIKLEKMKEENKVQIKIAELNAISANNAKS